MTEPEDTKVTSTQKALSSVHDPGWNDPPKWVLNPSESSITPTKRLLNKRVAFPLNSVTNSSTSTSQPPVSLPLNLPPSVSCQGKANNSSEAVSSKSNQEAAETRSTIDKEGSLNETLVNLETVIEKHLQSETKAQEVRKRIETMKTMWRDNKLDNNLCEKVLNLSQALREENLEKADKIHISLMMEHSSVCSSWIPGIRHLILEMKTK